MHKTKSSLFYTKLRQCQKEAQENTKIEMLCVDFMQNIPYSHLPIGEMFYLRQLWLHTFRIYSGKLKKSTMFMWPETQDKRGANEVVSCLSKYIIEKIDSSVETHYIFSDGAAGQNKNHCMVAFFSTLIKMGRFMMIVHHFPIRGHSFLPCDRHFGLIERMKRKKEEVQHYTEWVEMVRAKFDIISMTGQDMLDFQRHFQRYFKKTVTKKRIKFKISENKVFTYAPAMKMRFKFRRQCQIFGHICLD